MRVRRVVVIYCPVRVWLDDVAFRLGIAAPGLRVVKAEGRKEAEGALVDTQVRCVVFALMTRERGGWSWLRNLDLTGAGCPIVEVLAQGESPPHLTEVEARTQAHRWVRDGDIAALKVMLQQMAARKRGPKPALAPKAAVLPLPWNAAEKARMTLDHPVRPAKRMSAVVPA